MQRDFTSPLSHGSPGEHHHNERYDGEFSSLLTLCAACKYAHKCRVTSATASVSPLVIKQGHEIKWIDKDGYRFTRGFNTHYKLQTAFDLPLN